MPGIDAHSRLLKPLARGSMLEASSAAALRTNTNTNTLHVDLNEDNKPSAGSTLAQLLRPGVLPTSKNGANVRVRSSSTSPESMYKKDRKMEIVEQLQCEARRDVDGQDSIEGLTRRERHVAFAVVEGDDDGGEPVLRARRQSIPETNSFREKYVGIGMRGDELSVFTTRDEKSVSTRREEGGVGSEDVRRKPSHVAERIREARIHGMDGGFGATRPRSMSLE
jgi:hypothetical protein